MHYSVNPKLLSTTNNFFVYFHFFGEYICNILQLHIINLYLDVRNITHYISVMEVFVLTSALILEVGEEHQLLREHKQA